GREIAIRTSKDSGPLSSGDYFEFYGQGLDLPDTDTRIYYLIAGTGPGKRAAVEPETVTPNASPVGTAASQPTAALGSEFLYRGWFGPLVSLISGEKTSTNAVGTNGGKPVVEQPQPKTVETSAAPVAIQPPAGETPTADPRNG